VVKRSRGSDNGEAKECLKGRREGMARLPSLSLASSGPIAGGSFTAQAFSYLPFASMVAYEP
jgi:hypothetical protein